MVTSPPFHNKQMTGGAGTAQSPHLLTQAKGSIFENSTSICNAASHGSCLTQELPKSAIALRDRALSQPPPAPPWPHTPLGVRWGVMTAMSITQIIRSNPQHFYNPAFLRETSMFCSLLCTRVLCLMGKKSRLRKYIGSTADPSATDCSWQNFTILLKYIVESKIQS